MSFLCCGLFLIGLLIAVEPAEDGLGELVREHADSLSHRSAFGVVTPLFKQDFKKDLCPSQDSVHNKQRRANTTAAFALPEKVEGG